MIHDIAPMSPIWSHPGRMPMRGGVDVAGEWKAQTKKDVLFVPSATKGDGGDHGLPKNMESLAAFVEATRDVVGMGRRTTPRFVAA